MTRVRRHWLAGLLGLCATLTIALLVWPTGAAPSTQLAPAEQYAGPDIETRRSGPVPGFALRLAGPDAAPQAAPPPEALPVIVGIAGRRAYLRGADGEVERVSIGEEIDGWRLVAVSARAAILRGPDGDRRIEMFASGSASPAATAESATPAAQGG